MASSEQLKQVTVIGSGNWRTAIAIHIAEKVRELKDKCDQKLIMQCKEETLENGKKITEVINKHHENAKYLPHERIPDNVVAEPAGSLCITNITHEVAEKVFCEATVGSHDDNHSEIVRELFDTPNFRLRFYPDIEIIEILGGLKNVIAMCAGFNIRAA
ncbi:unnamed protein product, partial [Rotaria sp. Silwood2]